MDQNAFPQPPPPYGPGTQLPYNGPRRVRFEAIGEAWQLLTQQMGIWVGSVLLIYVLFGTVMFVFFIAVMPVMLPMGGRVSPGASPDISVFGFLLMFVVYLALLVFGNFMVCGLHRMAVKQVKGELISLNDLFSCFDVVGQVILASLLTGLAAMVGFILCIIPGFIIMGLLMLVNPIIVDQKVGAIRAMEMSWNALKEDLVMAAVFFFVILCVVNLGSLACGIGILFTIPLFFLAQAIVYRDFFLAPAQAPSPYPTHEYPSSQPPSSNEPPPFEV